LATLYYGAFTSILGSIEVNAGNAIAIHYQYIYRLSKVQYVSELLQYVMDRNTRDIFYNI
ncbi:MAG TPA: hypothetical protein PLC05_03215, partial [bacterium]|nr:hypothetical protein [bacterium]HPL56476.1 hypothetical protein [bacterium]